MVHRNHRFNMCRLISVTPYPRPKRWCLRRAALPPAGVVAEEQLKVLRRGEKQGTYLKYAADSIFRIRKILNLFSHRGKPTMKEVVYLYLC
jgi:hypothetical protein